MAADGAARATSLKGVARFCRRIHRGHQWQTHACNRKASDLDIDAPAARTERQVAGSHRSIHLLHFGA